MGANDSAHDRIAAGEVLEGLGGRHLKSFISGRARFNHVSLRPKACLQHPSQNEEESKRLTINRAKPSGYFIRALYALCVRPFSFRTVPRDGCCVRVVSC